MYVASFDHIVFCNTSHLDPAEWSISDCASWLESVELEEVRSVFIENSISGSELLDLTEDDMKSMGITKLGPRKKLLKRIAALRGECNSLTSSTNNASNVDSSEITESPEDTRTCGPFFDQLFPTTTCSDHGTCDCILTLQTSRFLVNFSCRLLNQAMLQRRLVLYQNHRRHDIQISTKAVGGSIRVPFEDQVL